MIAVDPPAVPCVFPTREHAEQLAALLREHCIATAAAPSDRHGEAWDALVPACDASRATRVVQSLLTHDAHGPGALGRGLGVGPVR
jgi:hypothetical protein